MFRSLFDESDLEYLTEGYEPGSKKNKKVTWKG